MLAGTFMCRCGITSNEQRIINNEQKTIAIPAFLSVAQRNVSLSNEIAITSTKWLYRLVREFWSTVRQIATGLAGGGLFNGHSNREVITVLFLRLPGRLITHYSLLIAARPNVGAVAGHAVNGCDLLRVGLDANQQSKGNKPSLARQDGAGNVAAPTL